jgi:hypothetical protein
MLSYYHVSTRSVVPPELADILCLSAVAEFYYRSEASKR